MFFYSYLLNLFIRINLQVCNELNTEKIITKVRNNSYNKIIIISYFYYYRGINLGVLQNKLLNFIIS